MSPPVRWSVEFKTMLKRLSVLCIIKGAVPSESIAAAIRISGERYSRRIRSFVLLPSRKAKAQIAEAACDITVARAAPLTPRSNPKIKMGSRRMLSTAPITTVAML